MTTAQTALSFSLCVVLILAVTGSHAAPPAKSSFNVVSYSKPKEEVVSTHVAINIAKFGEIKIEGYLDDYSNDTTTCIVQEYYWNCTYDDRPVWLNTSWASSILVSDTVCNVLVGFQNDRTVVEFISTSGFGSFNFSSTAPHKFTGGSCVTKDHVSYCHFDPKIGWAWAAVTGDTHGVHSVNWQCGV